MTVAELINQLQNVPQHLCVMTDIPTGYHKKEWAEVVEVKAYDVNLHCAFVGLASE